MFNFRKNKGEGKVTEPTKRPEIDEYQTLSRRIIDVDIDLQRLIQRVNTLELENKDLRDKVLRKIQKQTRPMMYGTQT